MKKIALSILLVLFVFTAAFANGQEEAAAPEGVDVSEAAAAFFADYPEGGYIIKEDAFLQKFVSGEEMFVIDIRRPDDYAAGHIKGAVNMPWGPAIAADLASVPTDVPVYLYCYSGQTAGQTVALMNVAGIPVKSVRYGYKFGIATVDGYEEAVDTVAVALPEAEREIDPNIQAAVDAYFAEISEAAGTPFASNIISSENAKKIHDAGDESVQFVDIRRPDDYDEGHIEGAINLPYGAGMQDLFASLPADKKLIVNCYSGQTAGQAVAIMELMGYDAVSLKGGMGTPKNKPMGWTTEGFPVVLD